MVTPKVKPLNHSSRLTITSKLKRTHPEATSGPLLTPPYLFLLHAEFCCFHSSDSLMSSRSHSKDHSPGPSLCSTVPTVTRGGCYPLHCPCGVRTFLMPLKRPAIESQSKAFTIKDLVYSDKQFGRGACF